MNKKFNFKKLDLQLFAEPNEENGNGGGEPNPKTPKYSDSDYEKLKGEYDKLKGSFDKTSSEIADLKKQIKAKQTDDEKKAEEEQERLAESERVKKELATLKIERKLASDFTEEEINELSPLVVSNDTEKLVECIVKLRQEFKKKVYDEAKAEFSKSAHLPGGSGGNKEDTPELVQKYLDSKKSSSKTTAREKYFGKK